MNYIKIKVYLISFTVVVFILSTDSKYYLFGKKNDIFLGSVLVFLRVTLLKAIVLSRFLGK